MGIVIDSMFPDIARVFVVYNTLALFLHPPSIYPVTWESTPSKSFSGSFILDLMDGSVTHIFRKFEVCSQQQQHQQHQQHQNEN